MLAHPATGRPLIAYSEVSDVPVAGVRAPSVQAPLLSRDLGDERLGIRIEDDWGIRGRTWNGAASELDGAVFTLGD